MRSVIKTRKFMWKIAAVKKVKETETEGDMWMNKAYRITKI